MNANIEIEKFLLYSINNVLEAQDRTNFSAMLLSALHHAGIETKAFGVRNAGVEQFLVSLMATGDEAFRLIFARIGITEKDVVRIRDGFVKGMQRDHTPVTVPTPSVIEAMKLAAERANGRLTGERDFLYGLLKKGNNSQHLFSPLGLRFDLDLEWL